MNVLVVHNRYQEPGGEDRDVELETGLLRRHGHTVTPYILDNASIDGMNRALLVDRLNPTLHKPIDDDYRLQYPRFPQ